MLHGRMRSSSKYEAKRFKPDPGHRSANQAVIGSCLPLRAANVNQRWRGDKRRRYKAGLLQRGWRTQNLSLRATFTGYGTTFNLLYYSTHYYSGPDLCVCPCARQTNGLPDWCSNQPLSCCIHKLYGILILYLFYDRLTNVHLFPTFRC